jgi:hypothetical protein
MIKHNKKTNGNNKKRTEGVVYSMIIYFPASILNVLGVRCWAIYIPEHRCDYVVGKMKIPLVLIIKHALFIVTQAFYLVHESRLFA